MESLRSVSLAREPQERSSECAADFVILVLGRTQPLKFHLVGHQLGHVEAGLELDGPDHEAVILADLGGGVVELLGQAGELLGTLVNTNARLGGAPQQRAVLVERRALGCRQQVFQKGHG